MGSVIVIHGSSTIRLLDSYMIKVSIYRDTLFYSLFQMLCLFFYYKLKVCDNVILSKSFGTIFPTVFAHFMSLCHILEILAIFKIIILSNGDLRSLMLLL